MRTIAITLASSIVLLSCSTGDHEDLRLWMSEATKDIKGKIPPLPQVKPYEAVPYDAGNLIDPFKPSKISSEQKKNGGGLQPDMNRPREPLEAFPLESMKYVGVMTKKNVSYAVIQFDSTLYQIRVGNYMGPNFGIVIKISESEVTLKELVQDATGDWVEKLNMLLLQEKEGKK